MNLSHDFIELFYFIGIDHFLVFVFVKKNGVRELSDQREFRLVSCYMLMLHLLFFLLTEVAVEREVEGDLIELDAGMGVPFRPGSFDACVRYTIYLFNY